MALLGKSAARQLYDLSDVAGNSDSEKLSVVRTDEFSAADVLG